MSRFATTPVYYVIGIAAMALVVVASNVLVQFPFAYTLGAVDLADLLTWGAFTYPVAFLVTDFVNRRMGPRAARRVVLVGFAFAVVLSIVLATPRIAIASGTAFLLAQMLDVWVFDHLRRRVWWVPPVASSMVGSIVDTALFFTLAFAAALTVLGPNDGFAVEAAPLFGVLEFAAPRWVSWALGDFAVKLLVAGALLVPYRILLGLIRPLPAETTA